MARRLGAALVLLGGALAAVLSAGCRKTELLDAVTCTAEVADLRAWLTVVEKEGDVRAEVIRDPADEYHYLDRPLPRVPLTHVEDAPSPMPNIGLVTLDKGEVHHDVVKARASDAKAVTQVLGRLSASGLSPGFGGGGAGGSWYHQPLVMMIGDGEKWSDVVALLHATARGGFTTVDFAFAAATSARTPDLEGPVAKKIIELASDPKEMPWRRDVAIAHELARANEQFCSSVAGPFEKEAHDSVAMDAQRKEFMTKAADAFSACNCRGDPAAIRAFAWARFGRHWGATSVSYSLSIGLADAKDVEDRPTETIDAPATATWHDVHSKIIEAAKRKARVAFRAR